MMRGLTSVVALAACAALLLPASTGAQQGSYFLSVTAAGGRVTSSPPGINCGEGAADCLIRIAERTRVMLTATEVFPDHPFNNWGGDCTGVQPTCTVVMDDNRSVTAQFGVPQQPPPPPRSGFLTVSRKGNGVVRSTPVGINCGRLCTAIYNSGGSGTRISLTAIPGRSARFLGWGGNCAGRARVCTLTVSGVHLVQARFTERTFTLCHRGKTIRVSAGKVRRHRLHGDRLGRCRTR